MVFVSLLYISVLNDSIISLLSFYDQTRHVIYIKNLHIELQVSHTVGFCQTYEKYHISNGPPGARDFVQFNFSTLKLYSIKIIIYTTVLFLTRLNMYYTNETADKQIYFLNTQLSVIEKLHLDVDQITMVIKCIKDKTRLG